ncbi:probable 2-oxoglutarate-dependent dioxygenase At3g111800 [Quercus lobata]|uniref:probable 2-oxoglutarate-dependent dioxygenase At3g111800 n=1 Tax=Quercus lobata TaxID=97700 RepID=UPI0012449A13|nr:probable 2-oxoglutarate-dependent dioxygenase At3g111800 [Quercus lobata]
MAYLVVCVRFLPIMAQSGPYIQPPHNRPHHHSSTVTAAAAATIDLVEFNPTHLPSIRSTIAQAYTDYGAFHDTNHGVPTKLLRQIKTTGLTFFNQSSIDDKLTYSCDPHSFASQGYGSRMLLSDENDTVVLDWRDYFDHHTLPLSRRDPSRWPHFPENYRETVVSYSNEMKGLAQKLMGLISESLGLRGLYIEDAVGEGCSGPKQETFFRIGTKSSKNEM